MVTAPPQIERNKLSTAVVNAFEEAILSGSLAVGERMPAEAEIARNFGVSTRSVREAMQILEMKGLVRRRHGERAEVVRDDIGQYLNSLATTVRTLFQREPAYVVKIMDVRRLFEVDAARRLAAGEGRLDGSIEAALERMQESVGARDFPSYADADAAFHLAIVHSLGNEILSTLYDNVYALITDTIRISVRVPSKSMENGIKEHRGIYREIRSGDPDRAAAALETHLRNSTEYLRIALTRQQPDTST
ncbi:FadR/GntR family transcriptional regulator [Acuticoccus mangrovi]|uniref:FadR family transcriptional regulator n=1 Tax=Acuticoccus mangrovi TaxID=2796142 RepID=A0A934IL16_9HYPH|nr:FadR/GntR family transcriptional regulator [Acuticoccus mangrovi]MBJ3774291.1 FadR family transcriptional regulator [Acuticoccus mangrovi]